MTPIELIAIVFCALVLIKIVTILISHKSWASLAKSLYNSPKITGILMLVLGAIVFYYLYLELTIIQITAVIAFTTLLIGFGAMQYSREVTTIIKRIMDKKFSAGVIFYTLLWLALIGWTVYAIFF